MPGRGDCGGGEVLQRGAAGENMESTTRGGLVEVRMSCGGNRLGRTHAGRKLLQKLKKSALSALGR